MSDVFRSLYQSKKQQKQPEIDIPYYTGIVVLVAVSYAQL